MKLFLDTNIFIEFIEHRKQYEPVSQIIDAIIEEQHTACISTGCLYTLAYLFERGLKLQDIHKPELTLRIRHLLAEVLNMSTIVPLAHANSQVAADKGRAAIERGPLVYCAEWADNTCDVLSVLLNQEPQYQLGHVAIANTDVQTLITDAQTLKFDARGRLTTTDEHLTLIPYYAWAHRGNGNMAVWLPIDLSASKPALPPSIASQSKISASQRDLPSLSAINDRLLPADGNNRSKRHEIIRN